MGVQVAHVFPNGEHGWNPVQVPLTKLDAGANTGQGLYLTGGKNPLKKNSHKVFASLALLGGMPKVSSLFNPLLDFSKLSPGVIEKGIMMEFRKNSLLLHFLIIKNSFFS